MSHHSERFIAANAKSWVVHAQVVYDAREEPVGCCYRLANGETFNLLAADCQLIVPRWSHLEGQCP